MGLFIFLIVVVVLVSLPAWLLGRRDARAEVAEAPRPPSWGELAVRERGDRLGRDADDNAAPARKLVDNLSIGIEIDYRNAEGVGSHRAVLIDGIFGESLDWPTYVVGYDTLSGERRTFNLERIEALYRTDGEPPLVEAIPYWIGCLARDAAGLPHPREPFEQAVDAPIVVTERSAETGAERVRKGRLTRLEMTYGPRGRVWRLHVTGRLGKGGERSVAYRVPSNPRRVWSVASVACGETGEIIDDLAAWVEALKV